MEKKNDRFKKIILWTLAILFLAPLYWLLISSLKTDMEITQFPPTFWPKEFAFDNFPKVWDLLHFNRTFFNSILVSVSTTILVVFNSTLAGYAFAKKKFVGVNDNFDRNYDNSGNCVIITIVYCYH